MRTKKCILLIVSCFPLFGQPTAWANPTSDNASPLQDGRNITCIVSDELGAIAGANVKVKGTTIGNITDADGRASLKNVPAGATLVVSYIGYASQEINVGNQSVVEVRLVEDTQKLSEVVVVGYGTQKKVNLTGAVEQIGEEVFENRPISNVTQALEGAVPNLNINLTDGKPNRTASFNVRGTTSIGQGGSALVLIDGVEGDPALLNPNDIASVSVLKDAASAAIYGARGSFGVVLITTKSPNKDKTSITYNGSIAAKKIVARTDNVSDGVTWAEHFREAYYNRLYTIPTSINAQQDFSDTWLENFKQRKAAGITDEVEIDESGKYVYYGNTDWYDELFKETAYANDHNVTIQGGNEKADFYISGRYYGYNGLYNYNPDKYHTYNIRAKGSLKVYDWLKVTENMEYSNTDYHLPITAASASTNIYRYMEVTAFPTSVIKNPDGSHTYNSAYSLGSLMEGNNYKNTTTNLIKNTIGFNASFFGNTFRIIGDYTFRYNTSDIFMKRMRVPYSRYEGVTSYLSPTINRAQEVDSHTMYNAANIYAEYENTFGDGHCFKAMAGYNYESSKYAYNSLTRSGLILESAESIALATGESMTPSVSASNWEILGLFARLNYSYKDRYLVEFNGRYDGSSKFPSNSKYAFFPSISLGWRASEEKFWKVDPEIINSLKIRASYGSLGNGNISPYSYLEILSFSTSSLLLNGQKNVYTSRPSVIPDNLTWETATTTDIGIDFSMLKGKLSFSGDYYLRRTTDMYTVGVTLPDVFGATAPKGNYADMDTRGWEVSADYNDSFRLRGKPFNFNVKASLFDYKSRITRYNNSTYSLSDYYEGQTVGEIWGFVTDGLFQTEEDLDGYVNTVISASADGVWRLGDVKMVDLDGDGRITIGDNTKDNPGDKKIIGNSEPRYQYSLTLGADWNNFFFSAFFHGVGKQDWYPGKESTFWGQYNRPYNSMPSWHLNNYWTEDNRDAYLPRYCTYNGTAGWSGIANDRYLQNISYIRLKNLQIGYTIPQKITSKIGANIVRVYLSGENLWCWSPMYKRTGNSIDVFSITRGTDADLGSTNSGAGNSYPLLKSYSFGLSVTF